MDALAEHIAHDRTRVVSTDVFDTILLRDRHIEAERMARTCRQAAPLLDVDPKALTGLRWALHDAAYRAVALERPDGEATLEAICAAMSSALGQGPDVARRLRGIEVEVDIAHLRPNGRLLTLLDAAARAGTRIIAVSDTWYSTSDLRYILDVVLGDHPIDAVYSSADAGMTKHSGRLYGEVARREGVEPHHFVHVGDNYAVDVEQARAAGWSAVHLPPRLGTRAIKVFGRMAAVPLWARRSA